MGVSARLAQTSGALRCGVAGPLGRELRARRQPRPPPACAAYSRPPPRGSHMPRRNRPELSFIARTRTPAPPSASPGPSTPGSGALQGQLRRTAVKKEVGSTPTGGVPLRPHFPLSRRFCLFDTPVAASRARASVDNRSRCPPLPSFISPVNLPLCGIGLACQPPRVATRSGLRPLSA